MCPVSRSSIPDDGSLYMTLLLTFPCTVVVVYDYSAKSRCVPFPALRFLSGIWADMVVLGGVIRGVVAPYGSVKGT
jgi:hypothetical protein